MTFVDLSEPKGFLYLIADSHIGEPHAPADELINALKNLPNPQCIVCLGDLFNVWLGDVKFWTPAQSLVLQTWQELTQNEVMTCLTVGNRDLLTSRLASHHQKKIFTHVVHQELQIQWGKHLFGFTHGDEINKNDRNYLRWKAFIRHPMTEFLIRRIPASYAIKFLASGEAKLAKTNREFKVYLPMEELQRFANQLPNQLALYFLGHFHTEQTIEDSSGLERIKIVADWLASKSVLAIDPNGKMQVLRWQNQSWY